MNSGVDLSEPREVAADAWAGGAERQAGDSDPGAGAERAGEPVDLPDDALHELLRALAGLTGHDDRAMGAEDVADAGDDAGVSVSGGDTNGDERTFGAFG